MLEEMARLKYETWAGGFYRAISWTVSTAAHLQMI